MITVGDIVSIQNSSRYGVVAECFEFAGETLYHVHSIDPRTGQLLQCPDSHCQGEHTCPIHGYNRREDQIEPFTQTDIETYVREGMIDRQLLLV